MSTVSRGGLMSCVVCGVLGAWPVGAQFPVFTPGERTTPVYGTRSRNHVPHWLELPRSARISTGDDIRMSPLHNAAISFENLKLGVLVGALRNDGGCLSSLNIRLQYVNEDWQPVGPPIPNEARVSEVGPGGILPYRFQLRTIADAKVPPAGLVVIVEQDHKPMTNPYTWNRWVSTAPRTEADNGPCPAPATRLETSVTKRQALREGYLVEGTLRLVEGGPVRADGLVITALLRDEADGVLEVLVGTPRAERRDPSPGVLEPGETVRFRLHTVMPLGRDVKDVDVMVEVLPEAVVADAGPAPR